MHATLLCRALLAATAGLGCQPAAAAAKYTYTDIIVPGALQTNPGGINDAGTVVGYSIDSSYNFHGFEFAAGKLTSFDVPGARSTVADGITDNGTIVGYYIDQSGTYQGFIYTVKGKFKTVNLPDGTATALRAMNSKGVILGGAVDSQSAVEVFLDRKGVFTTVTDSSNPVGIALNKSGAVAGYYEPPKSQETSFYYAKGKITTIPTKNVVFTQTFGMNDSGVVVGQVADNSRVEHGFIYDAHGRQVTYLDFPKSAGSYCTGINNAGTIAGVEYDSTGASQGYVYEGGQFTQLSIAGGTSVGATAINASGQVVGDYVTSSGTPATFLAIPAP